MSIPFLQFGEIYQKLKDIDLEKISTLASRLDLKELLDKISSLDESQLKQLVDYIHDLPVKP